MTRLFLLLALLALACGTAVPILPSATESVSPVPAKKQETKAPPTAEDGEFALVTAESLFLRSCAGTDCAPMDVLYYGDRVQITGGLRVSKSLECRLWYPVRVEDMEGFVCADWIKQ